MEKYLSNQKFWFIVRYLHRHLKDWQLAIKGTFQWLRSFSLHSIYSLLSCGFRYISDRYDMSEFKSRTIKIRSNRGTRKVNTERKKNFYQTCGEAKQFKRYEYAKMIEKINLVKHIN